jgi:hypothetical protein
MTRIFISFAKEDTICAEQLRQGFEAKGYTVWRELVALTSQSPSYIHTIENGILGSATVIFVWSSSAAQSQWTTKHLLFAQNLRKPFFFVVLDTTLLPDTLETIKSIQRQVSCAKAVPQLLPLLPPSNSTDTLMTLFEQSTSERIHVRRTAIQSAAQMLQQGEHREEVLALLNYLAHNDGTNNVRNDAQAVIQANIKKEQPWSDDTRHIFGVTCKNRHTSYFDKRIVCTASRSVVRGSQTSSPESSLDELHLICKTCHVDVVSYQDCREYK